MKTTVYWDRDGRPQGWAWRRGAWDDPCAESGAVDLDHEAPIEEAVAWACDEWDIEPAAWNIEPDEDGGWAETE